MSTDRTPEDEQPDLDGEGRDEPADTFDERLVDLLSWILDTETRARIYVYLREHPYSTSEEVATGTGLYPSTVREALAELTEEGTVERRKRQSDGAGNNPYEYDSIPPSELVAGVVEEVQSELNTVFNLDRHLGGCESEPASGPVTITVENESADDSEATKRGGAVTDGMRVVLGGTFDPVHDGHRALFERAFELGDLTVGLTSDELAPETRNEERRIRSFEQRKENLEEELSELADEYDREFEVRELMEPTGVATEPGFDVLIVSPETRDGARRVNEIREERGLDPLDIEVVDHVEAEDGGIISSTRIVQGEIDEHGNLLE